MPEHNRITVSFKDIPWLSGTQGQALNDSLLEYGNLLETIGIDDYLRQH